MNKKVCVIGIWHLGSVYSACLAELGYTVVGVDKDPTVVQDLNNGIPPVCEPDLKELMLKNIESGRLRYTSDLRNALNNTRYVLMTVDTPVDENDEVDLSPIFSISEELAKYLEDGSIIMVSSQVPVGTCDRIRLLIKQLNPSLDFDIACSPENLRLGQAIECFNKPERIVIGADRAATLDSVEAFWNVIGAPKLRMNLKTAEMSKHALNAFLATSISFANEIASLCDEVGANALEIGKALQSDTRIGAKLPLLPGLAFGGGTLARDIKILKNLANDAGCEVPLIDGVLRVNQRQNGLVVRKLQKIYSSLKSLTVGILGLTYKAGTSTLRRSAALDIIRDLTDEGVSVKAYDPKASLKDLQGQKKFEFCSSPYEVARGSDALVIATDWPEFRNLDFDLIKTSMKRPVLIDARNMLDEEQLIEKGFLYTGIGKGKF
jgi:UDPglucose 6-dehydrogenase